MFFLQGNFGRMIVVWPKASIVIEYCAFNNVATLLERKNAVQFHEISEKNGNFVSSVKKYILYIIISYGVLGLGLGYGDFRYLTFLNIHVWLTYFTTSKEVFFDLQILSRS